MVKENFEIRSKCLLYHNNNSRELYKVAFNSIEFKEYLDVFYSSRVEFSYLEEAEYVLNECNSCRGIYQVQIPNTKLMEQLYEKWIDPELAYLNYKESDSLALYSFYAKEIMQLIDYFNQSSSTLKFFEFVWGGGNGH